MTARVTVDFPRPVASAISLIVGMRSPRRNLGRLGLRHRFGRSVDYTPISPTSASFGATGDGGDSNGQSPGFGSCFGGRIDASIRSSGRIPCHRYASMALCGSQRAGLRISLRCDVRFEAGLTQEATAEVRLGVQDDCVTRGRRWKSSVAFGREPLVEAVADQMCGSIAASAPHGAPIDG